MATTNGFAGTINDNYWGSKDWGWGDVIGSTSTFGISSAEVTLSGTSLQIDIYTGFAGRGDDGLFSSVTPNGIGYGDLFLASSWDPYGSAPYQSDDNTNGTFWTYGFALDDNWGVNGGNGILYQLNGATNADNAILTDELFSGATYRNGQEVLVDETSPTTTAIRGGTWTIDEANGIIGFQMDISGTTLMDGSNIALHWGPTCANDIIEGSAAVPEPSTLLLLGAGLVGLFAFNRKKKHVLD